jgi:trk system potassium uptake protein TrkH
MALAAGAIAVEHGFYERPCEIWLLRVCTGAIVLAHGGLTVWAGLRRVGRAELIASLVLQVAFVVGLGMDLAGLPAGWRLVEAGVVLRLFAELWGAHLVLSRRLLRPEALLPVSFGALIVVGALLLKLPRAVPRDDPLGWVDALFTSTSAVCVTGLTVRNTASEFTGVGQMVILALIQLGGLGIIMFGSTLMLLLGRTMSLRENLSMSQMLADQPVHRLLGYGRFVLVATIVLELVGAALLYPMWSEREAAGASRLWLSVFHSVSAFCNAGFDITGESLTGHRTSPLSLVVVVMLIVMGGLGFPVLENLVRVGRARLHRLRGRPGLPAGYAVADARLSLHSRLVLATTLAVYLYGVVGILLGQLLQAGDPAGDGLGAGTVLRSLADAHFMSVTARTAGFNTLPMEHLAPSSVLVIMTLMIVGGSPGSTAGGAKTTTLAVLALSVVATMRQRPEAEAGGRAIADAIVRKAGTLGLCYFALIVACTFALSLVEPFRLEPVLFEVISAATTTGLSLGITPDLTPEGKLVIIGAMFLGRVGPLTLLTGLLFGRKHEHQYTLAHEGVALG